MTQQQVLGWVGSTTQFQHEGNVDAKNETASFYLYIPILIIPQHLENMSESKIPSRRIQNLQLLFFVFD